MLTNPQKTPRECLKIATERADGELKHDLCVLQASIFAEADEQKTQNFYREFAEKYSDDVIFDLFLDQIITATIEGRTNVDSIKDVKTYHNQIKKKRDRFMREKNQEAYNYKFISTVGFGMILALTLSFGADKFVNLYAHTPIGWTCSAVYLALLARHFLAFRKGLIDDNILEAKF